MERRILVPLDGSSLAETVLPHALMLARTNGSTLHLMRVVTTNFAAQSYAWPMGVPEALQITVETAHNEAQAYLERVAEQLHKHDPHVRWSIEVGDPAHAILQYAQQHDDVGMIALSTHGRSGVKRWLLGSVAEKLIQVAPVPMLVVPATTVPRLPSTAYQSLLVPLDGSSFAAQALGLAQCIADWYGASLHLLSAVAPAEHSNGSPTEVMPLWQIRARSETQRRAMAYLEDQAQQLRQRGFNVETHLAQDAPAESIIRFTEELAPDLVVMTTHGRNGLQQLWMGSVATRVIRGNSCPVLMTRGVANHEAKNGVPATSIVHTS